MEEVLYQLASPEVIKGGLSTIGLASFQPATGWKDFNYYKVSKLRNCFFQQLYNFDIFIGNIFFSQLHSL
jgi:hypothetical protein